MKKVTRMSYGVISGILLLVLALRLGTPFLAVLFSVFALQKFNSRVRKGVSVILFIVCVVAVFWGFGFFFDRTYKAIPEILDNSVPKMAELAQRYGEELPYRTRGDLGPLLMKSAKGQASELARFATVATRETILLIIGLVVGISIFLNGQIDLDRRHHRIQNNLYSLLCDEVALRFEIFYRCFRTVIGAQLLISTINTTLTSIFVFWIDLPYAVVIIGITFLCGLLPIVGNIISNCVIVGIAVTISPGFALAALIFLICIHKLEYFLNSKIIGGRIKNPMWLTLLGLIVGEKMMGIPGMILAPVVLHYLKVEMSEIEVLDTAAAAAPAETAKADAN